MNAEILTRHPMINVFDIIFLGIIATLLILLGNSPTIILAKPTNSTNASDGFLTYKDSQAAVNIDYPAGFQLGPVSNRFEKISQNATGNDTGMSKRQLNIALIEPTFTHSAYHNSFYIFYSLYHNISIHQHTINVTKHIDLLSARIVNHSHSLSLSPMPYLEKHLKWLLPRSNLTLLTDVDVDNGAVFMHNKTLNKYDIIILGHQEYVTQKEYNNLKRFVSNGGTMILMDSNFFYAEVKYNKKNQTITLVKGHGWAFNGKSAWRDVSERWKKETSEWVGSNYLCFPCVIIFHNNPFGYQHNEEQNITNPNARIILDYNASLLKHESPTYRLGKINVATYELRYKKGIVVSLGFMSDDILDNERFDRFFDSLLLKYAKLTGKSNE